MEKALDSNSNGVRKIKLFINNEWVDSSDGGEFESRNPATGEVIAKLSAATETDVDRAVEAAKKAFENKSWSGLTSDQRADLMIRAAQILEERKEEFIRIEAADSGKPISEVQGYDVPVAIRSLYYFGNLARELRGEVIPVPENDRFDYVTYEPYGVVGIITPWNFPIHLFTRGVCPAIAAGNTVVVKASSLAPVTSALMGEIFEAAGFPAGVVNIISGSGSVAGNALMKHPDVNMITFTGSEEVGRQALKIASESKIIKKVTLELGGKGAFIAEPDCDIDAAVDSALMGFCLNQGEVCCASSRLYLQESIYDEFINRLVDSANKIRIGNNLDPKTQMGSMISESQLIRADKYVKEAVKDGAKLLCGGHRLTGGEYDKGFFYAPTILACEDNKMACVQEEIFGPVLVVLKYKTLEEAIELANDSRFGLAATIWSNSIPTIFDAAKKLNAGTVWMNTNVMTNIEVAYGGNNNSGVGRECGIVGLKEYLRAKANVIYIGKEHGRSYVF